MSQQATLLKRLGWFDGFVFALTMPASLIASVGFSIGALGAWAAAALWGVSMVIATLANWIYSESATMFPQKSGGIALYAHEGWRRYSSLVGPVATFGYWFAWSGSLAVFAGIIGALVRDQWFPDQDWTVGFWIADITFPRLIAAAVLVAVWLVNALGLRPTMRVAYVTAAMLMVPLIVFIVFPYLTGSWHASNLTWDVGEPGQAWGGWRTAIVWLYIMLWTSLGVETCAAFAPEYRDTVRDTTRALRASALFSLAVFVLVPIGLGGVVAPTAVNADPAGLYVIAFQRIVGGASGVVTLFVIASLVLVMVTCMADSARALYGISVDRMTIRYFGRVNHRHVPGRSMTLDLVVNLLLVFLVGDVLGILAAGNLGYLLAHVFALSAFVLLRRDRPDAPRPIRLARPWVAIAMVLAASLSFVLVVGAVNFDETGYGGPRSLLIGLTVLLVAIGLYWYRRRVQDGEPFRLRDPEEAPVEGADDGEGPAPRERVSS